MSIKELRLEKGWSQEHLAELTNLSSRTIQRIEKDNKASLESLKALALAFEVEVSQLQDIMEDNIENEDTTNNLNKEYNSFIEYLKEDKRTIEFLVVNMLLIVINLVTTTEYFWFIYPLLGWGIPHFYKRYNLYQKLNK